MIPAAMVPLSGHEALSLATLGVSVLPPVGLGGPRADRRYQVLLLATAFPFPEALRFSLFRRCQQEPGFLDQATAVVEGVTAACGEAQMGAFTAGWWLVLHAELIALEGRYPAA